MARFNPFPKVSARFGAPMGRVSHNPGLCAGMQLCAHEQGGDGYYDRGGAYWGSSPEGPVWAVWQATKGEDGVVYVRAHSREEAINNAIGS